jgi:chromosome segregation ATPase
MSMDLSGTFNIVDKNFREVLTHLFKNGVAVLPITSDLKPGFKLIS